MDFCGHEKDNVGIVAACEKRKIIQKMPQYNSCRNEDEWEILPKG